MERAADGVREGETGGERWCLLLLRLLPSPIHQHNCRAPECRMHPMACLSLGLISVVARRFTIALPCSALDSGKQLHQGAHACLSAALATLGMSNKMLLPTTIDHYCAFSHADGSAWVTSYSLALCSAASSCHSPSVGHSSHAPTLPAASRPHPRRRRPAHTERWRVWTATDHCQQSRGEDTDRRWRRPRPTRRREAGDCHRKDGLTAAARRAAAASSGATADGAAGGTASQDAAAVASPTDGARSDLRG